MTDRESLRRAMAGADMVIHNAGHYEYGVNATGRRRMYDVNVRGTENVLGLAKELGIPRVVYVSTTQVYGDSGPELRDETFVRRTPERTWYERTKTEAHALALRSQEEGLPVVIACPNGAVGPNDHSVLGYFARMYLNRMLPPVAWSPGSMFSFVYLDDLAEGIAAVAERGRAGETYFLAGEPKSLREHLGTWSLRPGGMKVRLWLPPGLMAALLWPLEPLQRMAGLPAFLSRETVRGSALNLHYSNAKAKQELGWTPRPARQMWLDTLDGELELLRKRTKRTVTALLNPVEID